jgi:dTMP kinase
MIKSGKFITLEGGEGAGKSSQITALIAYLQDHSISAIATREPGGTPLGEAIRGLLLNNDEVAIDDDAELLLMFAARAQHIAEVIKPALQRGCWVVSDRFTDASYAYQAGGRGIDIERIRVLEQWLLDDFQPDLTLLLDVPVAVGLQRTQVRAGLADRIEQEEQSFFERVRAQYLLLAAQQPQRIKVIDANNALDAVSTNIAEHLERLLIAH